MLDHVTIRTGSKGRIVSAVQAALNARGENLSIDGTFGPKSDNAAARALCLKAPVTLRGLELAQLGVPLAYGIDLSGHNEGGTKRPVDFDRAKAAGVSFAWLKLTEGSRYSNPEAIRQAAECARVGIAVGGYHFGDPSAIRAMNLADLAADARAEATHYLDARRRTFLAASPGLPDVLDLEQAYQANLSSAAWAALGGTGGSRAELCALWCLFWLEHVQSATGVRPMIYSGKWAVDAYLARAPKSLQSKLFTYKLWLASYNSGAEPKRQIAGWPWSVWQYSGTGACPGVDGKVDLNVCLAKDIGL